MDSSFVIAPLTSDLSLHAMAKKRRNSNNHPFAPPLEAQPAPTSGSFHATRETIESIVVAFVLAFLFRTFQAEAFVIPTGSMSPSLMGQHKDVHCSECGCRFRTTASTEGEEGVGMGLPADQRQVLAGVCPMCRQTVAFREDLGSYLPPFIKPENIQEARTYPGDRVLVNKYGFTFHNPERWDVVVFKFPGDGSTNYIKRLVGLPNETLRVFQGDVFVKKDGEDEFHILHRPEHTLRAMLQPVFDTDYESATLYEAGWPLRWAADPGSQWETHAEPEGGNVDLSYSIDTPSQDPQWLAYHHTPPDQDVWARVFTGDTGRLAELAAPELIADFNPYNARILRAQVEGYRPNPQAVAPPPWYVEPQQLGTNWVGDLAVECDVRLDKLRGELLLDLVEAGKHFTCTIDAAKGLATLAVEGLPDFAPTAEIPGWKAGSKNLLFANVDDQLWLWVDGQPVPFDGAAYDSEAVFGVRGATTPQTSDEDPGDLQPVRVGVRDAALSISRLAVLRDIYYIAVKFSGEDTKFKDVRADYPLQSLTTDEGLRLPKLDELNYHDLFTTPRQWARFGMRQEEQFPIGNDQFFMMGDNSPESLDCRLWMSNRRRPGAGVPGGPYVDRDLLTGRALCVFWPHSWGGIPGVEYLPGWPGFGDMRIVR